MYGLANIDFSNQFGVVISELPDEIDDQDQMQDAKQGARAERPRDGRFWRCLERGNSWLNVQSGIERKRPRQDLAGRVHCRD